MELQNAERLARELISTHNPIVGFKFSNGFSRLGYYSPKYDMISLSKDFAQYNDERLVRDVILHEIAHSLTKGHHHDQVFRAKCKELGCNPLSRTKEIVKEPPKRYKYTCPNCGLVVYRQNKKYTLVCARCCRLYAKNQYTTKYRFDITENQEYEK